MRTLEELKGRCTIEPGDRLGEEHWIWAGGLSKGKASILAPDFTKDPTGNTMVVQFGPRAAVHLAYRKPIRRDKSAYQACLVPLCVNPACMRRWTKQEHGEFVAKSKRLSGLAHKKVAALKFWEGRRKITPAIVAEVRAGEMPIADLAKKHNVNVSGLYRARRGQHSLSTGIFSGLIAR